MTAENIHAHNVTELNYRNGGGIFPDPVPVAGSVIKQQGEHIFAPKFGQE